MEDIKLKDRIKGKITNLPLLPEVAIKLIEIIEDDDHTVRDVVGIIENDITLTGRALRVANSAIFSRGVEIQSLSRAILHLGEKMVMGIALGACSAEILSRPLEGYQSAAGELWDHSLRTAIASRLLTDFCPRKVPPETAFTAGLLHDIGKLVMSEFMEDTTEQIIEKLNRSRGMDYLEAERNFLGADHAEVGVELAMRWKLPYPIRESIAHHHRPDVDGLKHPGLVNLVHMGDIIAMMGGSGTGADSLAYRMSKTTSDYVRAGKQEFSLILLLVEKEFLVIKDTIMES